MLTLLKTLALLSKNKALMTAFLFCAVKLDERPDGFHK